MKIQNIAVIIRLNDSRTSEQRPLIDNPIKPLDHRDKVVTVVPLARRL